MTKNKIEKALYVNVSKKKRKEKIKANRGDTFVGCRSAYFTDKTKYDRKKSKQINLDF